MKLKFFAATAISTVLVFTLTACDPPMPPELRAQLEEQTHVCLETTQTVRFAPAAIDAAIASAEDMAANCPGMIMNPTVDAGESAQIEVIDSNAAESCVPSVSVPYALDAVAIVYSTSEGNSLNFDAKLLGQILSGQVTDWSDPEIARVNPGQEVTSEPIRVLSKTKASTLSRLNSWGKQNATTFDASLLKPSDNLAVSDIEQLESGEIAIVPYSLAFQAGLESGGVIAGKDLVKDVAFPEINSVESAGSQFKASTSGNAISLELDPTIAPVPAAGEDVASLPYQLIYPLWLHICGEATLEKRAIAKYLLRQDQQSILAGGQLFALPEGLRLKSLDLVSVGLPTPEIDLGATESTQ